MRTFCTALLLTLGLFLTGCQAATDEEADAPETPEATAQTQPMPMPDPPMAKIEPVSLEKHGHVRTDNYFWLKERDNPDVIAYLEAENAYTEAATAHTAELREAIFEEIKGRIKQDDASVPYKRDDYFYYRRYEEGQEYPIYCRKKGSLDAAEEILLDVNKLAEGHEFFAVSGVRVSTDHSVLSYGFDTVGRRF